MDMKSFYEHLRSSHEFGEQSEQNHKPVLRSSGIFPVIKNSSYSTEILFMSYWFLKRNISEISSLITLRDATGKIIKRNFILVNEPHAYNVSLDQMLNSTSLSNDFLGSIEVEFFSTHDMVFPYPALVLNYFNNEFNACVHTIGRIYNDFEDMMENEKLIVPESGFDIYSDDDLTSFFSFVSGPKIIENVTFQYVITNYKSEKFSGVFKINKINPYETVFLKLSDYIPKLNEILQRNSGAISIKHNLSGFYPRFLVGTIQKSFSSISFTHSYYDCSSCSSDSDYWNRLSTKYNDSSIYVPLFLENDFYTDLIFYPNLSPSTLNLEIDLYDAKGNMLKKLTNFKNISSRNLELLKINFNKLIQEHNIENKEIRTAQVIINSLEKKIPTRIKCGLNVGISGKKSKLPCNICFNLHPGNPLTEEKPGSFHWFPIFSLGNTVMSVANFSPLKNYSRSALLTLNFYHEHDSDTIERKIELQPFNEFRFNLDSDSEIKSFIHNSNGWVTMKANNPHIQGYYFNFHSSGSVAGDHVF